MTPFALIPAKGVSERLPGKNLKALGGRPLVGRAIDAARASELFGNRIVVSSEDPAIINYALGEGVRVLKRPPELSQPNAILAQVVEHAARQLEWRDAFYILTPTSPFRNPGTMRDAWDTYVRERPGALLSITPYEHPPYWGLLWDKTSQRLNPLDENCFVMPRENLPVAYRHDGAHQIIREQIPGVLGYPIAWEESIDINTERDWAYAEYMLASLKVPWATGTWTGGRTS